MEQARKHLKSSAIIVLLFAALTLIRIGLPLFFGGFNAAPGTDEFILMITKIVVISITFLMLLPQVYVGVKGLQNAKNPTTAKGHIVWATILLVFSAVSIVAPIAGVFSQGFVYDNVSAILQLALDICIYIEYIRCAKKVASLAGQGGI